MHNAESVFENQTHNILCDSEIQKDHLISARRTVLVIVNNKKETLPKSELYFSGWPQNWRKTKREINIWTFLENWKKKWNLKVTVIPIVIGALGIVIKRMVQGVVDLEIRERVETIIKIGYNSPEDLRRLAVTQTAV